MIHYLNSILINFHVYNLVRWKKTLIVFPVTFWKFSGLHGREKSFSMEKFYMTVNHYMVKIYEKLAVLHYNNLILYFLKFFFHSWILEKQSFSSFKAFMINKCSTKRHYFDENMTGNWFWPKSHKNFFGLGGFPLGQSRYRKHKYMYFFSPPYGSCYFC